MRNNARQSRDSGALLILGALLAPLLASCVSKARAPGVSLSSDPPGAMVLVNGVDSGFVTPCHLSLDKGDEHVVSFQLEGYVPAERELWPNMRTDIAYWDDADTWPRAFPFPIMLTFEDFWAPIKRDDSLSPRRVHVSLRLEGDE